MSASVAGETYCSACEGRPTRENSPCAVCGRRCLDPLPGERQHRGIPDGAGFCTDTDCWCSDPVQNPKHPARERWACASLQAEPLAWTTPIVWAPRQSEMVRKLTRTAQPQYGFSIPLYAHPPGAEAQVNAREPIAYVPVHPRNGPLWANVVTSKDQDYPRHYPLMPLYGGPVCEPGCICPPTTVSDACPACGPQRAEAAKG